jgi:hypothetical protein
MDAGWTRFLLERYRFPYTVLHDPDVRKGSLRANHDVIIVPSASARSLVQGRDASEMPAQFAGGLGAAGTAALRSFVEAGGTLVLLDAAGELAIRDLGAPVQDALADLGRDQFYCPGSLLRIAVDNTHPVAFGMPEQATAFFVNSSAYELPASDAASDVRVVAGYPDRELLESGWILGEEHLRGRAAVLEVPMGDGRMILLGFRTQFRAQPHETFKLLFNSILYGAAVPADLP